jgi:hypothetical protein
MARESHDREDLLREATALVRRCELTTPDEPESIVLGFRSPPSFSVYFGGDTHYQFNSQGELRRAYRDPFLYRAQRQRLIRLQRTSDSHSVALLSHELTPPELATFLTTADQRLDRLRANLVTGAFQLTARVPPDAPVIAEATDALDRILADFKVASSPRVS